MAAGRGRTWAKRIALAAVVLGGGFTAFNWSLVRAKYTGHELRSASTDDGRTHATQALLALGEPGYAQIVDTLHAGDAATCRVVAGVLRDHFAKLPANDTTFAVMLLDAAPTLGDAGLEVVLELLPMFLKANDAQIAEKCRAAVTHGLQASPAAKVASAKLASRAPLQQFTAIVPLLTDGDANVRAAAIMALGTAGDDAPITDEELFRATNDADATVRTVSEAVLETRGRTAEEIDLGRRLTHPQPRVRLQLLVDLAAESRRDIGPWLERLSRDAEPAVRAGAVRVASEKKLLYAEWADKLATTDADATVRQVATFHRRKAAGLIAPAGYTP